MGKGIRQSNFIDEFDKIMQRVSLCGKRAKLSAPCRLQSKKVNAVTSGAMN